MSLSDEEFRDTINALCEHLSETALTIEEITIRLSQLRNLTTPDENKSPEETTCYTNMTRHILGKPFFSSEDFDF